jgi:hypothetical protein
MFVVVPVLNIRWLLLASGPSLEDRERCDDDVLLENRHS